MNAQACDKGCLKVPCYCIALIFVGRYGECIFIHKDCVMDIFELANRLYLHLDKADTFPSLEEYLKSKVRNYHMFTRNILSL